jgi:DNA polymerase I-like protein with 3'-5' exonuclease and polymerase domains
MFGASARKLASILDCSLEESEKKMAVFWAANPGLKGLIDSLEKYYRKNKCLVGLDGRRLSIRGRHKLLNALIQSSAAIIFKRWDLIANARILQVGLDATQIINMHDELEYRTLDVDVEDTCEILLQSARDAGTYYNLKVPIEAECKVGANWSEVH